MKKKESINFIMGKNCIKEVLAHKKEIIEEIYTAIRKDSLISLIQEKYKNIKINYVSKHFLQNLVFSTSHQMFVAKIKKRVFFTLEEFLKKRSSLIVMLDSIFDPQNMGAILRVCECFSVDGVIFSKNRGVDITPTVSKSSAGASELISLIKVSNLHTSALSLKKEGFSIICSDITKKAENIKTFTFPEKVVLIMGSEGRGISPLLKKTADHTIKIPLLGKISSLNVSQATAIFLSFIKL